MKDLSLLLEKLKKFRDDRNWQQFHNHKDMALSLVLEAAEVLEHFQWRTEKEVKEYAKKNKDEIAQELADVLNYLVQLADNLEVEDIVDVAMEKLEKNALKYPVAKSKGKHAKYTKL